MESTWRPPLYIEKAPDDYTENTRKQYNIKVDGEDIPCIITHFEYMRFPKSIYEYLRSKNIRDPTPVQMQGFTTVLLKRDMIGIASTGSGKTLIFCIPIILFTIEYRLKHLKTPDPCALILVPSRELAKQIYDICLEICVFLMKDGFPTLDVLLCTGGVKIYVGCVVNADIIVATPGRLKDLVSKNKISLKNCYHLCLDEADKMIDPCFEDDIKNILLNMSKHRQTVLFSATMSPSIRNFAKRSLHRPIVLNVGINKSFDVNITQRFLSVNKERKLGSLMSCLTKTLPPVIIFSKSRLNVDRIHEFLIYHNIRAVAIHGGKTQEERAFSVSSIRNNIADVLIATDLASKGLDFKGIRHVINFDMPKEMEDYVHRIGRTGRSNGRGLATTFISDETHEPLLHNIKLYLEEMKQEVPLCLHRNK